MCDEEDNIMMIDYQEITEYYIKLIKDINHILYTTEKNCDNPEDKKKINDDYLKWYGSSDKAYYRIINILDMKDYYCEDDFMYYALEKLSDARHRIESYINDANPLLDFKDIDYKLYDVVVMDYYQPIRLSDDKEVRYNKEVSFSKYNSISHRRVMINLGLIEEIESVKDSFRDSKDLTLDEKYDNIKILDEMKDLAVQLNGYVENFDEEWS